MPLYLRERFKSYRQRISRTAFVQRLVASVLANYIRFVHLTSRYTLIVPASAQPYVSGEKPAIFAFWHGRLMMAAPFRPKGRSIKVLVSHHNDGELIAMTVSALKVEAIRGSSSSGGSKAARNIVRAFRAGSSIGITPDGPRGPFQTAQSGIIQLARLCDCPIIPVSLSGSLHTNLRSWDKMQIALPFGRLVGTVDEPLFVGTEGDDASIERDRLLLEQRLNAVTAQADAIASGKR
ncbi:MAG: DUF374 domain-containing protein [Alphaproteobacteria bacterium]|nr:DUF374 domain-containing protein [Alphaproteobacteria bacterium]